MSIPTSAGPYWWRKKDGDEWEIKEVTTRQTRGGFAFHVLNKYYWITVSKLGGQWVKVLKLDEGVEAWAVSDQFGDIITAEETWSGAWFSAARLCGTEQEFLRNGGYTCEPVIIVRKEKE